MGRRRKTQQHLPSRMYLRSGSYYFVEPGTERWINLGRDYIKAMGAYARRTADDSPRRTVDELINRYSREIAPTKAPRTYRDNIRQARYLRAFFGPMRLQDVTQQHIYKYMDERSRKSKVQANRELSLLSHMFRKAIRWGDIHHIENPCVGIERFKEVPRDRYIEHWEYLAFHEHAGTFIATYMDVKYLTGLRQGDLLRLRLDQLNDDGIHVTVGKTDKRIVIEWTTALWAAVNAARTLPRPVRGLFLFCNRKGQPYTGSGFRSIWQRRMRSALKKGVLQKRFTEHDIRAKSASDTDRGHAAELMTHLDARTTDRIYRRKPERIRPLR